MGRGGGGVENIAHDTQDDFKYCGTIKWITAIDPVKIVCIAESKIFFLRFFNTA